MPPLTFVQIQDRVLTEIGFPRTETAAADAELLFTVKRLTNQAYEDIWKRRHWTWLEKTFEFSSADDISAGTVNVTQNSQSVTLSTTIGTDFNKIIGRQFVVNSVAYRIRSATSGTVFELEHPFREATNATASYQILKSEYILPWDVDTILSIRDYNLRDPLQPIKDPFDDETRIRVGVPRWYYFKGHSFDNQYAVGTISASANATDTTGTITGASTTFSADGRVEVGNTILVFGPSGGASGTDEITNYPYKIRTITSDTALTVEPGIKEAYAAGTFYEINPRRSMIVVLYDWPNEIRHYEVKFLRKLPPLVADTDFPECPDEFHDMLVLRAKALNYERLGDFQQSQMANIEYERAIEELQWDDPVDQQLQEYQQTRTFIGIE